MAFPANTTRYLLFLCNLIFLVSSQLGLFLLEWLEKFDVNFLFF